MDEAPEALESAVILFPETLSFLLEAPTTSSKGEYPAAEKK